MAMTNASTEPLHPSPDPRCARSASSASEKSSGGGAEGGEAGEDPRESELSELRRLVRQQERQLRQLQQRRESFDYYAHPTERRSLLHLAEDKDRRRRRSSLDSSGSRKNSWNNSGSRKSSGCGGGDDDERPGKMEDEEKETSHSPAKMSPECPPADPAPPAPPPSSSSGLSWLKSASRFWKSFVVVIVPFICIPIALQGTEEDDTILAFRCAYVLVVMAAYWVTEAVPLAITSLVPVVLIPLFGIMTTDDVCREYLKESNHMLLSGIVVAIAVEHSNLHRRISLRVLLAVGTSPRLLMLGFMLTTTVLSMWISNTATTAMMVPILDAVLQEIEKDLEGQLNERQGNGVTMNEINAPQEEEKEEEEKSVSVHSASSQEGDDKPPPSRTRLMMFLAVAYAANTGGTGSLTGTGTNILFKGIVNDISHDNPISFISWLFFSVPIMFINMFLCWSWLQVWFMPSQTWELCVRQCRRRREGDEERRRHEAAVSSEVRRILQKEYDELGPITFHQIMVFILFLSMVLLWCLRDVWAASIQVIDIEYEKVNSSCVENCTYEEKVSLKEAVDDATAGMFIVILLFVLPARPNFWPIAKAGRSRPSTALLTWDAIHDRMPWALLLLMGGGFALSKATRVSGLSAWTAEQLEVLRPLDERLIVLIVSISAAMATEFTSNSATASIILPVLRDLAYSLNLNPLYLMIPATKACSFAFMMPVATPPNAIVYTASGMKTLDMVKCGAFLNVLYVFTSFVNLNALGGVVFDVFNSHPEWAQVGQTDGH